MRIWWRFLRERENLEDLGVYKKLKQSRYRPGGFQEVKVPRFRDSGTGWW